MQGGLARYRAEPADGIRHICSRKRSHHAAAERLQLALGIREVRNLLRLPIADDDVGAALENRPYEPRNLAGVVLIVAVGIDDDIGAEREARIETSAEGAGQPLVVGVADDMVDAKLACDRHGPVARPIVNDENL